MSFVNSILFSCFSNSFTPSFGCLYMKFRIIFLDFSVVISRRNDSRASQFIEKSCLVLQQNDYFTDLLLCDIAYTDKKIYPVKI